MDGPGMVRVTAKVAFSPETPLNAAQGGVVPAGGKRLLGDTVNLHGTHPEGPPSGERFSRGPRSVELVVNGRAAASAEVPADGNVHDLEFAVRIERSSWVALRHFPELHANPVEVLVEGKPIRASRRSALWCIEVIDLLWKNRAKAISPSEREAARRAFDEATAIYRRIAAEAPAGS